MDIYEMSHRDKLALLFRESHKLQEVTTGLSGTDRLIHAVSVFLSQSLKVYSIWSICNQVPRKEILENQRVIDDFSSGFVLLRSMYETLLASRFLLLDNEFSECRDIIVKVARLHGAREQNLLLTRVKSTKPEAKYIKSYCPRLKDELLKHNEYENLPQFAKDYIEKPDIPNHNWYSKKKFPLKELAHRVGINETIHLQFYKYFSNYTHSDPFALIQIGAIRDPMEARKMIDIVYWLAENFITISINIHRKVCDSEDISLHISEEVLELIEFWTFANVQEFVEPTTDK